MLTSPSIVLKALAGLVQEFGRQSEVTLGGRDMDMAEVSGQLRQQALHIRPLACPASTISSHRVASIKYLTERLIVVGGVAAGSFRCLPPATDPVGHHLVTKPLGHGSVAVTVGR